MLLKSLPAWVAFKNVSLKRRGIELSIDYNVIDSELHAFKNKNKETSEGWNYIHFMINTSLHCPFH